MSEETMIDTQQGILAYLHGGTHIPGQWVRRRTDGGMEMSVVVKGTVKGTATELEMAVGSDGALFTQFADMPYTELTRLGQSWSTMATSAVAALVVRPTTAAAFEIYNGNAQASLVIDRIFSHELVTSTTGLGGGAVMYAEVTQVKTAPTSGAFVIKGGSGKSYSGGVIAAAGTTVLDNGWFPYGYTTKKESAGAVVPGGALEAIIGGRLIVPPSCSLCLHVVSGYVADTFTSGATWYEKIFSSPNNPLL